HSELRRVERCPGEALLNGVRDPVVDVAGQIGRRRITALPQCVDDVHEPIEVPQRADRIRSVGPLEHPPAPVAIHEEVRGLALAGCERSDDAEAEGFDFGSYRPVNLASRRSRKAATPSRWSSD